jgi:hypothetical protein
LPLKIGTVASPVRLKDSTATLRDKSADYSKAKEFKKDDSLRQGILGVSVKEIATGGAAELLK